MTGFVLSSVGNPVSIVDLILSARGLKYLAYPDNRFPVISKIFFLGPDAE